MAVLVPNRANTVVSFSSVKGTPLTAIVPLPKGNVLLLFSSIKAVPRGPAITPIFGSGSGAGGQSYIVCT